MAKIMGYVRHRAPFIAMYIISAAMCALVGYLAGSDMAVAWYTVGLISFFFICILVVDINRYGKKLKLLSELSGTLSSLCRNIPRGDNGIEEKYAALLEEICLEFDDVTHSLMQSRADSLDYYTLWIHQIKTPIAALSLLLDSQKIDGASAAKQELFKIEQYAAMALKYIKLENIANDVVLAPCDVSLVIKAALRNFAIPFVYKGIAPIVKAEQAFFVTDSKWLQFMLEQLLSNAVKYTPSGSVTIALSGNTLVVEDTGIGIRQQDIPRIFEKGYTGYNGRIDERASGIGLYMVKRAADALSITVKAESTLGNGSRFTLVFPDDNRGIYK